VDNEAVDGHARDLVCTAQTLATDAACVEVLRAWDRHAIDAILLKGHTTSGWLYPAQARGYTDADLLVDPDRVIDAAHVLAELGFAPVAWHVSEHAHPWIRESDGATVDLHVTIWGPSRDARWVWRELQRWVVPYELGPVRARALSLPARALHVVLHAAQHREQPRNPEDLRRVLGAVSLADWREAERLADRLWALLPFAQGLMLEPPGRELLAQLPLARAAARAEYEGVPLAVGLARLAMAPGVRGKAAVVARSLQLRGEREPRSWARAQRLAWVLARVPATLRGIRR
jgi:hypothetical protein